MASGFCVLRTFSLLWGYKRTPQCFLEWVFIMQIILLKKKKTTGNTYTRYTTQKEGCAVKSLVNPFLSLSHSDPLFKGPAPISFIFFQRYSTHRLSNTPQRTWLVPQDREHKAGETTSCVGKTRQGSWRGQHFKWGFISPEEGLSKCTEVGKCR